MKRRKKRSEDLIHRFQTTCGWCGRKIPPNQEVFGGGGKARTDLTAHAGRVLPVQLVSLNKTVLIAVCGLDSEALRHGHDFMYMTCSEACGHSLIDAFKSAIEIGKELGLT